MLSGLAVAILEHADQAGDRQLRCHDRPISVVLTIKDSDSSLRPRGIGSQSYSHRDGGRQQPRGEVPRRPIPKKSAAPRAAFLRGVVSSLPEGRLAGRMGPAPGGPARDARPIPTASAFPARSTESVSVVVAVPIFRRSLAST